MRRVRSVVLFDIDGTLVQTSRAGVRGMNAAFAELHGLTNALEGVPIAGRTDRVIVSDAFAKAGVEPSPAAVDVLREAYMRHLPIEMARPAEGAFGVLPGVQALLDQLVAMAEVPVGLLTGNFERGAAIKLAHFDLWERFPFGAFGDDALDRRELVPVACARCRAAGLDVSPADLVIVGDTPLDVDCAHAHGAMAVAVATGLYTVDALREAGADLVVETLEALGEDARWLARVVSGGR
jgi:phosphoglycolate phosphatase-like HAD superfamily hydrolase